ncbi:MAG: CDP-glycerol glycerophosphotransferase family protein [Candidatus Helarchaeota archaeon]
MKIQYTFMNTAVFRVMEPLYYLQHGSIYLLSDRRNFSYERMKNIKFTTKLDKSALHVITSPYMRPEDFKKLIPYLYFPYVVNHKGYNYYETFDSHACKHADAIFLSGKYMETRMKKFNPNKKIYNIGFTKLDLYKREDKLDLNKYWKIKLDPNKKTVLYLPTRASLTNARDANFLSKLEKDYNILAKAHPIPFFPEEKGGRFIMSDVLYGWVKHADMIITDISTTFFESLPQQVPMVMVKNKKNLDWINETRDDICYVDTLAEAVDCILEGNIFKPNMKVIEPLFLYKMDFKASERALKIISEEYGNLE